VHNGTTDDLRRQLEDARAWAHERTLVNIDVGRSYLEDGGPFPERAAVNMLVGRFLDEFLDTVDRWAAWATDMTEAWPAHPRDAPIDPVELAETIEHAVERAARWNPPPATDQPGSAGQPSAVRADNGDQ
jgi:hypothetical protein